MPDRHRTAPAPIRTGLRGSEFWIVTEHGYASDYVKNIQADPRVRVKVGGRWYRGTARILPDDDPHERLRLLERPENDPLLLAVGTEQLTIRVDLDDAWRAVSRAGRQPSATNTSPACRIRTCRRYARSASTRPRVTTRAARPPRSRGCAKL